MNKQTRLIAEPVRALMDLVCHRKIEWQGTEWLQESMRVDDEHLRKITGADISTLKRVYKHKRVTLFLESLARESGND